MAASNSNNETVPLINREGVTTGYAGAQSASGVVAIVVEGGRFMTPDSARRLADMLRAAADDVEQGG